MAAKEGIRSGREGEEEEHVYRISTDKEWEELQRNGSCFGGQLDKSSGFIHLSKLDQVMSTLQNFFLNTKVDLYLLQIDAKKVCTLSFYLNSINNMLGDGLIYEVMDGTNSFPHFYGPSRSFSPLPLDVVIKAEKLVLADGQFSCSLLN
ncbi:hypothetical protein POTOM_010721 [Populus tomentosa]|uniref:DUF952 domain-containing protein n=1 Tax=Populus tomentosa TaxID=118781 RepID=A0A8X8D2I1_POPTO|nr:hypothetical protein POTOM_010721 [Populus tomentosa]